MLKPTQERVRKQKWGVKRLEVLTLGGSQLPYTIHGDQLFVAASNF